MEPNRKQVERRLSPVRGDVEKKSRGKPKSEAALYAQVARALKNEIANGTYPVGSQLPTETELCRVFSVSRHTVRDALRLLREEHLVSSRQGAGTVVIPPRTSDTLVLEATSIDALAGYAAEMQTEIHSARMEVVKGKPAERAGLRSGEEWLVVHGIGQTVEEERPLCWSEHYINREFAAVGRLLQRHTGPVFLLIEDLFALHIAEIEQEISATIISPALADRLQAEKESAAIEVRRTYKTADGRIAQITIHTHPASRFRHSVRMRRTKS